MVRDNLVAEREWLLQIKKIDALNTRKPEHEPKEKVDTDREGRCY